ncbi:MAG: histone deacetylase [Bacteriovoracaceae bacterium]|nr:histone deacetylase [Bacteriovoracaceae bacterium]
MILTPPKTFFSLLDFNIAISLDDRVKKTLAYLECKYPKELFYPATPDMMPVARNDLLLVHTREFVDKLFGPGLPAEIHECFELSQYGVDGGDKKDLTILRDQIFLQCAYTFHAMKLSIEHGFCYFLGGGMHHAKSDRGSGFCLVNDIVLGIKKLQKQMKIKTAWVIDVDAHKGDGTSELTENDDSIQTLSIHMKDGWPLSFTPSTVDIPVGDGGERDYLSLLESGLFELEKKSAELPDIAVVVDGADPYELDELPGSALLKLSSGQMLKRDQMVYDFLTKREIPQTFVIGGGYGKEVWRIYVQFIDWLVLMRDK